MWRFNHTRVSGSPVHRPMRVRSPWRVLARALLLAMITLTAAGLVPTARHAQAASTTPHLERPRSLVPLLERAAAKKQPIVLLFSIEGCGWCLRLRRDQMFGLAAQEATRGIQVIEFDLNDDTPFTAPAQPAPKPAVTGWLADIRSPYMLAFRLGVRIAPTVVFLGPTGEIADRLEGYTTPDFYSAYLDERIAKARASLRGGK